VNAGKTALRSHTLRYRRQMFIVEAFSMRRWRAQEIQHERFIWLLPVVLLCFLAGCTGARKHHPGSFPGVTRPLGCTPADKFSLMEGECNAHENGTPGSADDSSSMDTGDRKRFECDRLHADLWACLPHIGDGGSTGAIAQVQAGAIHGNKAISEFPRMRSNWLWQAAAAWTSVLTAKCSTSPGRIPAHSILRLQPELICKHRWSVYRLATK